MLSTVFKFETPPFLKRKHREAELHKLMGKIYSVNQIQARIYEIVLKDDGSTISWAETLFDPRFSRATLAGCLLAALHQLSGINIIILYNGIIFEGIFNTVNILTVIVTLANFVPLIPALFMLRRFGRRPLYIGGSVITSLALLGLGLSFILTGH